MTIYLFTTTDFKGSRSQDLARYLRSLQAQNISPGSIESYLLLQNCSLEQREMFRTKLPDYCHLLNDPSVLSLSSARNRLLDAFQATRIMNQDDVVGFPDDDCWLPDGFAASLSDTFHLLPFLGLVICGVSLQPEPGVFDKSDVRLARIAEVVRLASSNCMFVRGDLAQRVGYFDPGLGLGTPAQGGEDTDFIIRAFLKTSYAGIIDRELIGHRKPDSASKARYYVGGLLVLARYGKQSPGLMWEFCRKFLVGLYFVTSGRLSAFNCLNAFVQGFRAFVASANRTETIK